MPSRPRTAIAQSSRCRARHAAPALRSAGPAPAQEGGQPDCVRGGARATSRPRDGWAARPPWRAANPARRRGRAGARSARALRNRADQRRSGLAAGQRTSPTSAVGRPALAREGRSSGTAASSTQHPLRPRYEARRANTAIRRRHSDLLRSGVPAVYTFGSGLGRTRSGRPKARYFARKSVACDRRDDAAGGACSRGPSSLGALHGWGGDGWIERVSRPTRADRGVVGTLASSRGQPVRRTRCTRRG